MAQVDANLPVTREELEATLQREGFVQQGSVWWSQDRTKFVCFPDDSSGEAIYGDSEIGEPGKTVPISVARRVVRGDLLLDSPLGVMPAQQREPAVLAPREVRALGWSDREIERELAPWPAKAPRGLTADDPLPALPVHADQKKRPDVTWFVDSPSLSNENEDEPPHLRSSLPLPSHFRESPKRHETLRPPPSDRPVDVRARPVLSLPNPDAPLYETKERARFHQVTKKLRWAAITMAALVFVVGPFLPSGPRAVLVYLSVAVSVVIVGTIVTLLWLAWRSKKNA